MTTVRALIVFFLAMHVRNYRWLLAITLFTIILIAGAIGTNEPHEFFAYSLVFATAVALQFSIADAAATGFHRFLRNLADGRKVFFASLVSAVLMLIALATAAGGVATLVWRDLSTAWWYAAYWFLLMLAISPITLLVEVLTDMRFPAAIAVLLIFIAAVIVYKLDPLLLTRLLGNEASPGSLRPLGKLLAFNLSWNPPALMLAYVVLQLRETLASRP